MLCKRQKEEEEEEEEEEEDEEEEEPAPQVQSGAHKRSASAGTLPLLEIKTPVISFLNTFIKQPHKSTFNNINNIK